ncbi:MAG: glycosyltransferase family 2 protein [Actinomycetota bacterium]|nr:glycosyltransferase family 2 protein [Actinomycetota bacterium]
MVYVLIPAHNNRQAVLTILDCLSEQTYQDFKVVLIDDGSTDGTYDAVIKQFPDTIVLKGDGNLWWTGANYIGVDYILGHAGPEDFILLLNNDLTIDKDYIYHLVNASIENGRAIVGSTTIDSANPGYIEAGIKSDSFLNLSVNRDRHDIESSDFSFDVDVLPGRGTLIPIEVFKKIGNFNMRKLPHYGADYEFMVRAKRAGFKLMVSHKARVYARSDITGFSAPGREIISIKECFNLLFSKKSNINIYYYLNYVWLCSERGRRLRNLAYSTIRILSSTFFKTSFMIPVKKLVLEPAFFVVKFLFLKYPLMENDIRRHGLFPADLVKQGIMIKYNRGHKEFYNLVSKRSLDERVASLAEVDKSNVYKLNKLSRNHFYKLRFLRRSLIGWNR